MKEDILKLMPSNDVLEKRFSFLKNTILRDNVVIAFRYLTFLLTLQTKEKFRGIIAYSIYKDIILYTASVVESCIHYTLEQLISKNIVMLEDVMPSDWVDVENSCKDIFVIQTDKRKVCGVIKEKRPKKFNKKTNIKVLNHAIKKAGILNKTLSGKVDALFEQRNKIHLVGLEKADDYYGKRDLNKAFITASLVLNELESKLNSLSVNN